MNIRQVEIFKAVMEAGTVTEAGERLRVSQPSVSKYLRLLEDSIGVPLFDRTGNRLTPTEPARALYRQIDRSYRGLDQIARFAEGLKHHPLGEISVAAMPMLARRWLPELLEPFLRAHESVSIALPIRSSRWIIEAAGAGQVDIGLCLEAQDPPGVTQQRLMGLPLVCAMLAGHELAARPKVTPADLAGRTLITLSNFDQWRLAVEMILEAHAVRPRRQVDTFATEVACELVARGVGVAIVDLPTAQDFAERGVIWRPFRPAQQFSIALVQPRFTRLTPLAAELIDTIKASADGLVSRLPETSGP